MKTTRLLLATFLFIGFLIVGTGCVSLGMFQKVSNESSDFSSEDGALEVFSDGRGLDYSSYVITNQNEDYPVESVKIGDVLYLDVEDLSGYEMIDGVYYPQMDVTVFDSYATIVYQAEDVLSPEFDDGLLDGMYVYPTSTLVIDEEIFQPGESYVWASTLKDTIGGGELGFSVIFKVEE